MTIVIGYFFYEVNFFLGGGGYFFKILGNSLFRTSISLYTLGQGFQKVVGKFFKILAKYTALFESILSLLVQKFQLQNILLNRSSHFLCQNVAVKQYLWKLL